MASSRTLPIAAVLALATVPACNSSHHELEKAKTKLRIARDRLHEAEAESSKLKKEAEVTRTTLREVEAEIQGIHKDRATRCIMANIGVPALGSGFSPFPPTPFHSTCEVRFWSSLLGAVNARNDMSLYAWLAGGRSTQLVTPAHGTLPLPLESMVDPAAAEIEGIRWL